MYEKFTDRARRSMVSANNWAKKLGYEYIQVAHILLGIVDDKESMAWKLLESFGLDRESLQFQAQIANEMTNIETNAGKLQCTPRVRHCIDLAFSESIALGDMHVGTEHLLLGILAEGESFAAMIMNSDGIKIESAREKLKLLRSAA